MDAPGEQILFMRQEEEMKGEPTYCIFNGAGVIWSGNLLASL